MSKTNTIEDFWRKVKRSPDGCWEWQGGRLSSQYGYMRVNSRSKLAHRIAYEDAYGAIPAGLQVCHKCDNPPCCRPTHLFLGDQKANIADMIAKGRLVIGVRHNGERHHNAKLSDEQVRAIRADLRPARALGKIYGVSKTMILDIRKRKWWKYLQ